MTPRRVPEANPHTVRIAVLENLRDNAPNSEQDAPDCWAELGARGDVDGIVEALARAGHVAEFFEGDARLLEVLPKFRPDLCFNICEGHFGEGRECHVPALLEMLRLPHTGAGVPALALTLEKALTNRLLGSYGLPTPPHQLFYAADEPLDPGLRFPLFVKPVREGSSKGVSKDSLVRDGRQLRERVAWAISTYRQPAMVERFIRGREITVGLLGNHERAGGDTTALVALPPFEILFGGAPDGVYTYQIKSSTPDGWAAGINYQCPAPLDDQHWREIERLAKAAFVYTGCRDYARVDFRLDAEDALRPYILEVNALPGIFRAWSDISFAAAAAGMSYDELILSIVGHAAARYRLSAT
jgi:D-alanine-D-alanine ligase